MFNSGYLDFAWSDFGRSLSNKTRINDQLHLDDMYKEAMDKTFTKWNFWANRNNLTLSLPLISILQSLHNEALEVKMLSTEIHFNTIVRAAERYVLGLDTVIIGEIERSVGRPIVIVDSLLERMERLSDDNKEIRGDVTDLKNNNTELSDKITLLMQMFASSSNTSEEVEISI